MTVGDRSPLGTHRLSRAMSFLFPEEANMSAVLQANIELDCKNLLCPVPIIKISQAIKLVAIGGTIRMEATDPGSRHDVAAWARQTGHELLETGQAGRVYTFLVRRSH
jgi:tRNA 2-thiouridine synthesizing protein A